jgi:putative DNA primase/helicase
LNREFRVTYPLLQQWKKGKFQMSEKQIDIDSPSLQPSGDDPSTIDATTASATESELSSLAGEELWPSEVDGAELLDSLTQRISQHSVLLPGRAETIALWVVHAHAHEAADHSPILALLSPEKRCGKTTNLIMLYQLVPNPKLTSNITASALYRATSGQSVTLLIDEADRLLRGASWIGIIQSAHARLGGTVDRTDSKGNPIQFSVYGPKAIAMIGNLEDTLADRSIIIEMRRKRPDESCERLRPSVFAALAELKRKAARFAADHYTTLMDADPAIPQGLYDRAEQNWRPLLAIADAAGGDWPERARRIAVDMAGSTNDDSSPATLLLSDIRDLYERGRVDKIITSILVAALIKMEERPWARWSKSLAAANLADLLRPFGIKPKRMRHGNGVARGYERAMFEDVWIRYLPPPSTPMPLDQVDSLKEAIVFVNNLSKEDDKIQ